MAKIRGKEGRPKGKRQKQEGDKGELRGNAKRRSVRKRGSKRRQERARG